MYPSINIIKRYIGFQGKVLDSDKLESFAKQIKNAISKGKVKQEDPYLDKVNAVSASLKKLKGGDELNIGKAELNGLSGIGTYCGCQKANTRGRRNFEAAKSRTFRKRNDELGELPVTMPGGVLSAEQMANRKFDSIQLSPAYSQLIGKPAKNFSMMIHGEPGAGKTSFLLTFAKYLAENCGQVLFVTSEEFDASTMTDKINRYINPKPAGLFFSPSLHEVDLSPYAFVVLDSVNSLGLKLPDFKALQAEYRGVAFILVLQHTKQVSTEEEKIGSMKPR